MITFHVNKTESILSLRFYGNVSINEWVEAILKAKDEDPDVIKFNTLIDARDIKTFVPSQMDDFVRIVNSMDMNKFPRRSVVIVASQAAYGVSRMFELMTEYNGKVERFTTRSIEDAAAILDRPVDVIHKELIALFSI